MTGGPGARSRRLAVGFDRGAVSAGELVRSLPRDLEVEFLLPDNDYASSTRPILACAGEVHPADYGSAARLAARGLDGVVTFSETMLPYCSDLAERAGVPFPGGLLLRALTDKDAQRRCLRAAGCDPTRSVRCTTDGVAAAVTRVGTPCVVKPARGQASAHTVLVEASGRPLPRPVGGGDDWVVEEYLRGADQVPRAEELGVSAARLGDYVSVESVVCDGVAHHVAITGKFPFAAPFREVGQFWPAGLPRETEDGIGALVSRALSAIGMTLGLTHTEVKLTHEGPRIIEVNGRLGGHVHELYRRAAGLDLARDGIAVALGETPRGGPTWRDGVTFQYNSPAPATATAYLGTDGARAVRATPGVEGYRTYLALGHTLSPGAGTQPVDLLTGWAPDHGSMFAVLDRALGALRHRFAVAGHDTALPPERPWFAG